jgi:predicted enzyme related to lactoylglutathione lyase
MITNISSVSIYVEDQNRAKAFWVEQVGFRLVRDVPMGPDGSWMEVAPPGGGTVLVLYPRTYMKNWDRMQPSIMFECADIRETYARMAANGVSFLDKPMSMKWGTFARFVDPDGYVHFLKERSQTKTP